jgi:hypothetical protein
MECPSCKNKVWKCAKCAYEMDTRSNIDRVMFFEDALSGIRTNDELMMIDKERIEDESQPFGYGMKNGELICYCLIKRGKEVLLKLAQNQHSSMYESFGSNRQILESRWVLIKIPPQAKDYMEW